eukprot:TRINITY_DN191_c1_g3_i2.p2 TRINITY_DN191_c1_g3~~TRINITY_DN191_c1_g3_i2.p2  ORF type:complete len:224 (-),score=5.49 TRINITY_DN191_c1_g3_i2:11-682(-)
MSLLVILIVLQNLIQSQQKSPVYYFESPGVGIVVSPSGQPVKTISGQIASTQISALQCGQICYSQFEKCKCCNGFDYNPNENNGSCYLRRFPTTSEGLILYNETKKNAGGWQSYIGWGESTVSEGYTGSFPQHIQIDLTIPSWHIDPISYRIGYSTIGPTLAPQNQGENVRTSKGFMQLKNMNLLDCAVGSDRFKKKQNLLLEFLRIKSLLKNCEMFTNFVSV